ncbi:MAG: hypothetical protein DRH12_02505 [Deltaproteobacteria bacterium]|nr:MAG: hypothetical protein DRH12_02505 [Deltaproteobacteria bacterium]
MKKTNGLLIGAIILVGIFFTFVAFGSVSAIAGQKIYRMKIQSAYPRGDISMELLKYFADRTKERSNGRILISVFADPELVPAEQLFEATQKGTLDMLHAVAAMWGGIVPVGEVEFGLPYAYNIPGDKDIIETGRIVRDFFYKSGLVKLLRQEYGKHGLFWLDMHSYGKIITMSRTCITSCDQFKGKKFRVEGSWADYYNGLGARGTYIPGTDAYMGLKLGTIDASQWDISAITGLKWYEVAPYWLVGGQNDVVPGHILVNMKSWNALPKNLQQALLGAAEDYYHKLLDSYMVEYKKADDLVKAGKIKKCVLDAECDKKCAEVANKLWDKIAKRDPAAAKAIEMIREWRKTLR